MSPTNSSLPLLRKRADLVAVPQQVGRSRRWSIKDPVSLKYFHLGEEEYFLLQQFDGITSLAVMRERFECRFAPLRVTVRQLLGYGARLHGQGLLLSSQPDQAGVLLQRARQHRRQERLRMFSNPLAVRFPGFNAAWLIDWIYPVAKGCFRPTGVLIAVLIVCFTGMLMVGQSAEIAERMPRMGEFLALKNLPLLMASLVLIKLLHELGHAVACRSFGGECNEIGVMLLVFTPCLYCNVSDAWMLRSKWQRIVVSAAGIYVELVMACVAALVWYFSEPGTLNSLCLNTMAICTVGTVLFNGNPLLRYDGYFILSDFLEIPNLAEQSRKAIGDPVMNWLRRSPRASDPEDKGRGLAVAYGLLSTCYRWLVVGVILWGLYQFLGAHQLQSLGVGLVVFCLLAMALGPAKKLWQFWRTPAPMELNLARARIAGLAVFGLLAAILFVPLPSSIRAPAIVEIQDAQPIVATSEGVLRRSVRYGDFVDKGVLIAELENLAIQRRVETLDGEIASLQRELDNLRLQSNLDATIRSRIPMTEEALASARQRRATLAEKQAELHLVAPGSGTILRPTARQLPPEAKNEQLAFWTGAVLDPVNEGCFVRRGDPVCLLGDVRRLRVKAFVGQDDIDLADVGDDVVLLLHQSDAVLRGEVSEISSATTDELPAAIAASGELAVQQTGSSTIPVEATYAVLIDLDEMPDYVRRGSSGIARIETRSRTIAARLSRLVDQVFRFEL